MRLVRAKYDFIRPSQPARHICGMIETGGILDLIEDASPERSSDEQRGVVEVGKNNNNNNNSPGQHPQRLAAPAGASQVILQEMDELASKDDPDGIVVCAGAVVLCCVVLFSRDGVVNRQE